MMKYIIGIFLVASPMYGMRVMVAQMAADEEHQDARAAQGSIMAHINPKGVKLTADEFNGLLAKVTRDPARIVGQKVIHSIEMKAYRYREALLPALFLWQFDKGFSGMFDYMAKRIEAVAKIYRENNAVARTLPNKTILSVNFLSDRDEIMIADLRNPVTDYVKIIGRKLRQNEVAIVGYADGSHEFKLSEVDRGAANHLSHEQLDCIIDLYQAHDASWLVKSNRYETILGSLSLNMQFKLAVNYKIPVEWFIRDFLSDTYRAYAGITRDVEAAKQEKVIIEQEQKKIKDEISREKWFHTYEMEREKANAKRLQDERKNRPYWKRHGRIMLATVAAFAVGWLGKCYWSSVSSSMSSWFGIVKNKCGYR